MLVVRVIGLILLRVVLVTAGVLMPARSHASTCNELERTLIDAVRARDVAKAVAMHEHAEASRTCVGQALTLVGRNVAYAHYVGAFEQGTGPAQRERLLRTGLKLGRPWQVLASVADLDKAAKRYGEAAALYQEALDDIRDESLNPKAPPVDVIAALVKKAEAARLLASDYERRVDRNGGPAGLACTTFRGFTVRRTALPIEFVYKSTEFTEKGRKAADDLVDYLTRQGAPAIHLIGHTDPIGGDAYNQALSEQRSAAVKSYLLGKGFKGDIRTSGRGRSDPFQADDPGAYSEQERHQLDRRVEVDRQGGRPCDPP